MVKNRLIFTLLQQRGTFVLSRNFRLQLVGNLDWLIRHYNFETIAFSIDELIVLNVERGEKDIEEFSRNLRELSKYCLMPIAAGGGIRTFNDARLIMNSGADKLVINTPLYTQKELVTELVEVFGNQCIVASIDYTKKNDDESVMIDNGSRHTGWSIKAAVANAQDLGAGEIYITSMDQDGTGQGLDIEVIQRIGQVSKVPIIASGGVGNYAQVAEGFQEGNVKAVSTANLFNFLGNGLVETRKYLIEKNLNMAVWDREWNALVS